MSADPFAGIPLDAVQAALDAVEHEHDVRVLLAVESGSRAWGFASPDSDVDVRFLYVHRPAWYLRVQAGRDVIEQMLPGDLDVSGWDLRKVLGLLGASNPPLLEWLRSPLVYRADAAAVAGLNALVPHVYSRRACAHHYTRMAGHTMTYLRGDTVRRKRYLYAVRPLLAARWVIEREDAPPMELAPLAEAFPPPARAASELDALLDAKRAGSERSEGPPLPALAAWLAEELEALRPRVDEMPRATPDPARLDAAFVERLSAVWGDSFRTAP